MRALFIHQKTFQAIIYTEKEDVIKEERITTEKRKDTEFFSDFEELKIAIDICNNWEYIFEIPEIDIDTSNPSIEKLDNFIYYYVILKIR